MTAEKRAKRWKHEKYGGHMGERGAYHPGFRAVPEQDYLLIMAVYRSAVKLAKSKGAGHYEAELKLRQKVARSQR